jgi:hypothetical protein
MEPKALIRAIDQLLESQPDNKRLRDNLEGLSKDPAFPGVTWSWGPKLYARSRPIFRSFILNQFSDWAVDAKGKWTRVYWTDHSKELEDWLTAARAARDTNLIRRLLRWKYAKIKGWGTDDVRFSAALLEAYRAASGPAARAVVLDEFNDWFTLDEGTAVKLYETDQRSSKFILDHAPRQFWGSADKRAMWDKLGTLARSKGDEKLFRALYRKLIPVARWREDVLALAKSETDLAKLNDELIERHPEGYNLGLTPTVIELLEQRGRDVFGYVRAKLNETVGGWGKDNDAKRMIDLAASRGWWDLWTAAVRTGPDAHYKAGVASVLDDRALSDEQKRERLRGLAGVSQEWNWPGLGLARVHSLEDNLASLMYQRFPDLVRGPFRAQVTPRWWGQGYPKLVGLARTANDTELMDTLAARYATHVSWQARYGRKDDKPDQQKITASELAKYYQDIREKDEEAFARRAAGVLTRIPAFTLHAYHALLRHNDLARLLFSRSLPSFLTSPVAVQDLVEGSDIHVMGLGYRILGLRDPRAVELAGANIDILLGTLLRPIHRKTRLAAFQALANAARSGPEAAKRIHARARDALKLPNKKYPKVELIGLIGAILEAAPELRSPREQQVIYRRPQRSAA